MPENVSYHPKSAVAEDRDPEGSLVEAKPHIPSVLAVLPLRESVIFPTLIAPLSVSRLASVEAIEASVRDEDRLVAILTQRSSYTEDLTSDDLYDFGCVGIIRTMVKMSDATRLIVQGLSRFRVVETLQTEPYLKVRIEVIDEPEITKDMADEAEAMRRSIASMFEQAVLLTPTLPDELRNLSQAVAEPNTMADLVAAHLQLTCEEKQEILETVPLLARQKALLETLNREVRVLELSTKVQEEVSSELSKMQREHYLREQMKAIQRELGEFGDWEEEIDNLRDRMAASGLPESAWPEVNRELERLRRISPNSPEYTVTRTYLETMAALPWDKCTEDKLDLASVQETLSRDHFGLAQVKERILEFLAVRKVKKDGRIRQPILCFVGPPGVGKTSLGRSIADAMGRKFVRISLGGLRDEAEIRGHRKTYIGAMPGQIIQNLRRCESNNPVIVLDEIDKLASDFRGDPSSALLEVLDPEQNSSFRDHYLDVPFDLGKAMFIATANRVDTIPPALRDRMEVIEIEGYTEAEKFEICRRHLVPKQISEHGLTKGKVEIPDQAVHQVIASYTREAGVRNLERAIGSIVRKVTRHFAEGRKAKITVTSRVIEEALGPPKYLLDEVSERPLRPGMAIGLAWTPVGGDILFVEAAIMPGKGLTVTGQLGEVMKESITAALSFIRSHGQTLRVDAGILDSQEIHVHVPAGAVPKDGPSAGLAMFVALLGLMRNSMPRPFLAMTGEMTLTGQVLAVGGIKEKVLAAHRAGVRVLILPKDNERDAIHDIPAEIRRDLEMHFVSRAEEVVKLAFS
ncbi:MAG: endopeptidase La [Chthonomonas sp.]|nr:endopeptidase La [Chthonomonas sp.]